ncbi:MAG: glycosyltransferase family 2 protein [Ruminococcus flavefaciens]|nr:glycosyltransferase family 2 protein [Ruminococcus flavefaciens]
MDKVVILLCTYNGEKYIQEQLDSILKQTYCEWICYIHDDNSTDSTPKILEDYMNNYPDRFKLLNYQNTKHGASENFMSLLKFASINCSEKYYMLCDQDDSWLPEKIEKSVRAMEDDESFSGIKLVYCDQFVTNEKLKIIVDSTHKLVGKSLKDDNFTRIIFRNTAAGCCMLFNKDLLNLIAQLRDNENIVMHDWWIMLVASYVGKVFFLNEPLMLYRQHDDNTVGVDSNNWKKKAKKYLTNYETSINARKEQTARCKLQMSELRQLHQDSSRQKELNLFFEICKKNKISRCFLFLKNGYIAKNNLFLLLFV